MRRLLHHPARRQIARALLASAVALLAACAARGGRSAAADERPYVVLVSFDGFRHDYLDRFRPPNFERVARRGVRARALVPSFPSKTFPNHYSIATGLHPGGHGIVGNQFFDPSRRAWYTLSNRAAVEDGSWYGGEPIWVTAERQGVRTAAFFWPGSEAAISGVRPSLYRRYDEAIPDSARVDTVISWLRLPLAQRPHFVALYFSEVDDVGHAVGPESAGVADAVRAVDAALGRLLDSLAVLPIADRVNVLLVGDHGMVTVPASNVVRLTDLVSLDGALVSDGGPTMSLWFGADTARRDSVHAVLARGLTHARVYRRGEAPARWHVRDNPRFGDLLVVADTGWVLSTRPGTGAVSRGQHGYDPAMPSMHTIFLAAGAHIRPLGTIASVENVHLYPLMAHLLRIEPAAPIDGRLEMLRPILRRDPGRR